MLYSAFSNGMREFVMTATFWPCKFHASTLCITLVTCKAVYDSLLRTLLLTEHCKIVCDSTLQIFCASLPIQCQLHNDMCDNGVIAIKCVCVCYAGPCGGGKAQSSCRTGISTSKKVQASCKEIHRGGFWLLAVLPSDHYMHKQVCMVLTGSNFGLLEGLEECNDIPNSYWSSAKLLYPLLPPIECN